MRTECPYVDPLPESLLSGKQQIGYASHDEVEFLSNTDMTKEVWTDSEHQSARVLAKHFSNALILSRLEIVPIVLEALASRHQNGAFSRGDVAYALMGFLNQYTEFAKSTLSSRQLQASPWLMIGIKPWREWSPCSQDMTIAGDLCYRMIL